MTTISSLRVPPILMRSLAVLGAMLILCTVWPFFAYAFALREGTSQTASIKINWLGLGQAVFLTAIWEEAVFRLLPLWLSTRTRISNIPHALPVALTISSLGFASAHLSSQPWWIALPVLTPVGYLLARLYLAHQESSPIRAYFACTSVHAAFLFIRFSISLA